jgi:hypothetical protein
VILLVYLAVYLMVGNVHRLELSPGSIGECREGPSRLLLMKIAEMNSGDRIIIEGVDEVIPFRIVVEVLESEGFQITGEHRDPPLYTIEAVKK